MNSGSSNLTDDKLVKKDIKLLLSSKREQVKQKDKVENRKKELMGTTKKGKHAFPKWVEHNQPFYDAQHFNYYDEDEEQDPESLNEIAKMLGLPPPGDE